MLFHFQDHLKIRSKKLLTMRSPGLYLFWNPQQNAFQYVLPNRLISAGFDSCLCIRCKPRSKTKDESGRGTDNPRVCLFNEMRSLRLIRQSRFQQGNFLFSSLQCNTKTYDTYIQTYSFCLYGLNIGKLFCFKLLLFL